MCGPELSDLAHHLGGRYPDLKIFGVNAGGRFGEESPGHLRRFVAQFDLTFPVLLDDIGYRGALRGSGGEALSPFPFQVLIDRDGRIAYIKRQHDMDALDAAVGRVLAGGAAGAGP